MKKFFFFFSFCLVCGLVLCANCFADVGHTGILTGITKSFQLATSKWVSIILFYAERLFWLLAVISLVFTFGYMLFEGPDIAKFFGTFIRFTITLGVFWWLLKNGPEIAESIINSLHLISMKALAQTAGSVEVKGASDVMDLALNIFEKMGNNMAWMGPGDSMVAGLVSVGVLVIIALIAANITIEWCATWILLYAGCIVLGFGSLGATRESVVSYYKMVVAQGLRLMTMILMVGIAGAILGSLTADIEKGLKLKDCAVIFVSAAILFMLINKVPDMISGLIGIQTPAAGTLGGWAMAGAVGGVAAGATLGAMQGATNAVRDASNVASAANQASAAGAGLGSIIKAAGAGGAAAMGQKLGSVFGLTPSGTSPADSGIMKGMASSIGTSPADSGIMKGMASSIRSAPDKDSGSGNIS